AWFLAAEPFRCSITRKTTLGQGDFHMTKSIRALLVGAALTGFVAGTTASAVAQNTGGDKTTKSDTGKKATKVKKEKHACKGQNSCKGKGGCKTGDNGCKGKNSCKGLGGCRTDGKKMTEAPKTEAPK